MSLLDLLAVLALIQGVVSLVEGRRNMRYALDYTRGAVPTEPVVVFCPVKGAAADLEANARSLLRQNHPSFRVIFLVDSQEDPALAILRRLPGAQVEVVGMTTGRGQKVHCMIRGVETFRDSGLIFAFCDADARFGPDWLSELVAPLSDPATGATTGYRWYVPEPGDLGSRIRSAWNAAVAGVLGPHHRNFVWGGSMAIRREVFDRARVLESWQGALSDDYALARAVRQANLDIVYVPSCLVPSYGRCSLPELVEFTNRQIQITRVYAPRVWLLGVVTYTLFNLTFLWLTVALWSEWRFAGYWMAIYALAAIRADARARAASRTIEPDSIMRHRWFYRLSPPLVSWLFQINFLVSWFGRKILWKGIRYTLVSPNETRVEASLDQNAD